MPPLLTVALLALACAAVCAAMVAGWRGRARRTAVVVPELPDFPAADDAALGPARTAPIEGTYVSSTLAGDWLDRVVVHDLGVRSRAVTTVHAGGVCVQRTGARDLFIPAAALRGAAPAAGMAGKFVGRDGLVVLTWQAPGPGGTALDTGLRPRRAADRALLLEAVRTLVAAAADPPPHSPDRSGADQPGATTKEHP
ncbi:PH-like domain-containing protein [Pengzhenrongella sicca]|uniref:PH domain-containing protein n=1 Tax=Pengzhenrongella sicca TaxID=2819238 RepID=A0A8A4ZA98_9MICO|nr:hypothetical protein [Pengzhenrongella sicca]QTE27813.1 hypothetical protein J4E96_10265 [Pengzhenrongella sicca]